MKEATAMSVPTPTLPLNEMIIEKASQLFSEQGYAATSIKQIAKASGCTNAALYYYFDGGKEHILHEVIRHTAQERINLLSAAANADSFSALILQLSQTLAHSLSGMANRINWLMVEFPALPAEEQAALRDQLIGFHATLQTQIGRFVADAATADQMAWLVFCAFFGHQQIFGTMGVGQVVEIDLERYGRFMAQAITPTQI